MSAIFLLPGLLSFYLVIRGKLETAFLSVYLPALLLLPEGYALRLPHMPPISAAESALIPIGMVALMRLVQRGLPSIMDILVGALVMSITASEVFRERVMNHDSLHLHLSGLCYRAHDHRAGPPLCHCPSYGGPDSAARASRPVRMAIRTESVRRDRTEIVSVDQCPCRRSDSLRTRKNGRVFQRLRTGGDRLRDDRCPECVAFLSAQMEFGDGFRKAAWLA